MSTDDRRSNPLLQPDIAEQNMRGMAECMDMVRQELIEAGIVDKTVPPMMVANAVMQYINECRHDFNLAVDSVAVLQEEVFVMQARAEKAERHAVIAERKADHWRANHATEVDRARLLKDRTDMPVERVKAYELMGKLRDDNDQLRTELIAAYASRGALYDLCEGIATALDGPETPLEGFPWDDLVEVAVRVKEEAQRFAIVRAVAKTMEEDGGEQALLEAVEKYRAEHGL